MSYRKPISSEEIKKLQEEIAPLIEGFDAIPEHIIVTDLEGNIVYANSAAEAHTGFSRSEMIGHNPGDLWGGHMDDELYKTMWHTLKEQKIRFVGEVRNKRKDGTEYWQEIRIFPLFGEDGGLKCLVGIEPDITMRKVAEELQYKYLEELERLNKFMEGREVKVRELTNEVQELKNKLQALTRSQN